MITCWQETKDQGNPHCPPQWKLLWPKKLNPTLLRSPRDYRPTWSAREPITTLLRNSVRRCRFLITSRWAMTKASVTEARYQTPLKWDLQKSLEESYINARLTLIAKAKRLADGPALNTSALFKPYRSSEELTHGESRSTSGPELASRFSHMPRSILRRYKQLVGKSPTKKTLLN